MRSIASAGVVSAAILLCGCERGAAHAPGLTSQVSAGPRAASTRPRASTIIVVIMENRSYDSIIGNRQAPYINETLVPRAALMTDSHGVTHPSEPNYLALFSGSTQGVTDDSCPHEFSTANLGDRLRAVGWSFAGYSESMPRDGYRGCSYGDVYARKHNPWVDFGNVPPSSNRVWYGTAGSPRTVPRRSVSIVVPNMCNDMHDCSTPAGDHWLRGNLPSILQRDERTNGLLILTWDEAEPDASAENRIPTLLLGPMIVPGAYAQRIDHYAVLHTIERIAGARCTGAACAAPLLRGIWK